MELWDKHFLTVIKGKKRKEMSKKKPPYIKVMKTRLIKSNPTELWNAGG